MRRFGGDFSRVSEILEILPKSTKFLSFSLFFKSHSFYSKIFALLGILLGMSRFEEFLKGMAEVHGAMDGVRLSAKDFPLSTLLSRSLVMLRQRRHLRLSRRRTPLL